MLFEIRMEVKKQRLIWANIHVKDNNITPTYYFDFDKLNDLGFPDCEMLAFIMERKMYAQKEMKEKKNKKEKKN